ncbi:hypothetical protein COBT_001816 [Conglomerata obtusa]
MFTPENLKKLINVSIITQKKKNKKFELALYPNKLIEYKNNNKTPLSQILHTFAIFKDVSKGELANKKDLRECYGNLSDDDIIREILQYGNERISERTRDYMSDRRENEVYNLIMEKVTEDGCCMNMDRVKKVLKDNNCVIDARKDVKVQANEFIKKIVVNKKYKKVKMRIEIFDREIGNKYKIEFEEGKMVVYVTGEEFIELKNMCKAKNYRYVILQKKEVKEIEIC